MIKTGSTVINRITGERLTWIKTAADTGGASTTLNAVVKPGGLLAVRHLHTRQDETFEVRRGALRVELEGKQLHLRAGERLTINRGQKHQWWNDSDTAEVEFELTMSPALKFETFLEQYAGLCNGGKTDARGGFKFLQIMAMANEYDLVIAGPPVPVQRAMSAVIGRIARLFGYRKYYPEYSK